MLRGVAVAGWLVRVTLRRLVPLTWLRRTLIALGLGFAATLTAVLLVAPLPAAAREGTIAGLTGFLTLTVATSTAAALAGAAGLLRRPEQALLLRAAPLSPAQAAWLPLVSVLAAAVLPLTVMFAPFVVASVRIAPAGAALLAAAGAAAAGWAVVAAVALVATLARRHGRDRASRLAFAFSALLGFGGLALLGLLFRLPDRPGVLVVALAVSAASLPPLALRAARTLTSVLETGESGGTAPEPDWVSPPWWRLLRRTPALWGLAGALPAAAFLLRPDNPLRWGGLAMLAVIAVMVPLGHLFGPEFERPERWRLAPEAATVRRSILLRVGAPAAAAALVLVLAAGWGAWAWALVVAALVAITPLSFHLVAAAPRKLAQSAILLTAIATEVLR